MMCFSVWISPTLQTLNCNVLGPCRTALEALAAIAAHHPDAAVVALDLDPAGHTLTIANELIRSDISYFFVSRRGEEAADLPAWFTEQPHLQRLIPMEVLKIQIDALIDDSSK